MASETRTCSATRARSPRSVAQWKALVNQHLGIHPSEVTLSGMERWKLGTKLKPVNPSGSKLGFEHYLHFRSFVLERAPETFDLQGHVHEAYARAAERLVQPEVWPEDAFCQYLRLVAGTETDIEPSALDRLGLFAAAKVSQDLVLSATLGTVEPVPPQPAFIAADVDGGVQLGETPIKIHRPPGTSQGGHPDADAPDEMIVNQALIEFLTAVTQRWMRFSKIGRDSPSKGTDIGPIGTSRPLAQWTIERNRFHIKERVRTSDRDQEIRLGQKKHSASKVLQPFAQLLETQTDGHLYHTDEKEILAIVEAKKGSRGQLVNRAKIEWQEAAEVLAWLNIRLRTEWEENRRAGTWEKTNGRTRRGIMTGPDDKRRSLLISQNREEIYIVIAEWDKYYEYYALEGKMPEPKHNPQPQNLGGQAGTSLGVRGPEKPPSTPIKNLTAGLQRLNLGKKVGEAPVAPPPAPAATARQSGDSDRARYGIDAASRPEADDGFLVMNVYGPYSTRDAGQLRLLTEALIGLTMQLADVPLELAAYLAEAGPASRFP